MKLDAASLAAMALAVGAAGLAAAPAQARDLAETHTELHQPGGKTPARLYRQIARDRCAVAPRHVQVGKLPKARAASPADCAAEPARSGPPAGLAAN